MQLEKLFANSLLDKIHILAEDDFEKNIENSCNFWLG
jgi:hypothetical protein